MAAEEVPPPKRGEDFYAEGTVYTVVQVFARYYRSDAFRVSYNDGSKLRGCLIRKQPDGLWYRVHKETLDV